MLRGTVTSFRYNKVTVKSKDADMAPEWGDGQVADLEPGGCEFKSQQSHYNYQGLGAREATLSVLSGWGGILSCSSQVSVIACMQKWVDSSGIPSAT